jgi:hypothetical protein
MITHLARMGVWSFAIATVVCASAQADESVRSSPPDATPYSRPPVSDNFNPLNTAGKAQSGKADQFDVFVVDTVVNNTDPDLKITDMFNDGEVSIAVRPLHPNEIVITAFSGSWGLRAPLWRSSNRGNSWTKEFTINPPPGVAGVPGCPCDQTVDFTQSKNLAGAFLTAGPDNIYAALNRNPAALTFNYFESPPGVAQAATHLDGVNNEDQPWLLVVLSQGQVAKTSMLRMTTSTLHPTCMSPSRLQPTRRCLISTTGPGSAPDSSIPTIGWRSTQIPVQSTAYSSAA